MKLPHLQALKINARLILTLIISAALLNSCGKGESNSGVAALMFIHASPGLQPIDVFVNGNRVNGDSIISYTDTIPYKLLTSGSVPVTIKKHISSITYISRNIDLDPDKSYSFFVTGKPDSVTYLLTHDNVTAPASGKAKLRFLNLSPNSRPLDFKLSATNTLFTGQAFKSYTDFTSIDPGNYTVGIYEQGNTAPLAQHSLEVETGRFYTVWAKGMKGSTDPAAALSIQAISLK